MVGDIIPTAQVAQSIHLLRGQKVMLDFDLAHFYGVATKVLNQAVKRNQKRFPADFMFRLSADKTQRAVDEGAAKNWSQIVTSSHKHRGAIYRPYAFTEQGVAMLSSVLNSDHAIKVNIAINDWVVHASRVSVSASRRNELAIGFLSLLTAQVSRWQDFSRRSRRREIGFHVRETAARYGMRRCR